MMKTEIITPENPLFIVDDSNEYIIVTGGIATWDKENNLVGILIGIQDIITEKRMKQLKKESCNFRGFNF